MKRILLLALLAPAAVFTNCSNQTTVEDSREIKISASVMESPTKAAAYGPITSTFTTDFPIGVYATDATVGWKPSNLMNNDQSVVQGSAGHHVVLASGPYYYPANGDDVNFYAFAPQSPESTVAANGTSPKVTHTLTGHEDVMWCTAVGHKVGSAPAINPVFAFNHMLTQLQFTFKSGTAYPLSGYYVTSLLVKAQPSAAIMDVATGSLNFSATLADMQALTPLNKANGIEITAAGTDALSPIMTKVSATYTLDIYVRTPGTAANISYTNVPVTVTASVGSAHMITITFNETNASATATVADWLTGSGGSAVAQ